MLTAAELRHRLNWPAVDEQVSAQYCAVFLNIRPPSPDLASIDCCLDEGRTSVDRLGFGEWHYHPETLAEAVEMARQLVRGEKCVVEERDAAGAYRGSGPYAPDGLPDRLHRDTASLRRVFFGREPVAEAIDFGRYFRGKHFWVSHERKAEVERLYREIGQPAPEW